MSNNKLVIIIAICLSTLAFGFGGDYGEHDGYVPDGSADSPWLIEDFLDFQAFCGDSSKWSSDKHVRLDADIDLNPDLQGREVYCQAPIAYSTNQVDWIFEGVVFNGVFGGNRHTIKNLVIEGDYYCGLFGMVGPEGLVTDLYIYGADVSGTRDYCGVLAGYNCGDIEGCKVYGDVTAYSYVGGLCGKSLNGNISESFSGCTVQTSDANSSCVGGLCGSNESGTINSSYAIANVTGSNIVGGLCGENCMGVIDSCYAAGGLSGSSNVGGLVGYCYRLDEFPYEVCEPVEEEHCETVWDMWCHEAYIGEYCDEWGCGPMFEYICEEISYEECEVVTVEICHTEFRQIDEEDTSLVTRSFWDNSYCGESSGGVGFDSMTILYSPCMVIGQVGFYAGWTFPHYSYPRLLRHYPSQLSPDISSDGVIDSFDLQLFAWYWLEDNRLPLENITDCIIDDGGCELIGWCNDRDLNKDGYVDMVDLAIFAQSWLVVVE